MNRGHPADDSGLIDIKALMEASRAAERAPARPDAEHTPVPMVRTLDLYPFGAPEPPKPALPPEPPPAPRPNRMRVVLPAIGVLSLAGALAFVLLSGGPRDASPVPAAPAAQGPETAALPANPAGPASPANPANDGAAPSEATPPAETDALATSKTPVATPPVQKTPVKAPVQKTPVKTPPVRTPPVKTPPVKTPPASPCNGDLLCEMKRATGQR